MIIYNGKKYSCVSCIRGHRSSLCDHRERPLLEVRKRGRPLPESKRGMLLPKDEQDDNGNIITENYVFEPVGDGLYRKHPKGVLPPSPFMNSLDKDPGLIAPMDLTHKELVNRLGMTEEEVASVWPEGEQQSIIPSCVMPNLCQCGDSCACPDCFTHGDRSKLISGPSPLPNHSLPHTHQSPTLVHRGQ